MLPRCGPATGRSPRRGRGAFVAALTLAGSLWPCAAWAGGGQIDCREGASSNHWDKARQPSLSRYCDLVAQALSRLSTDPSQAEAAASEAARLLPGQAQPLLLRGRALSLLGKHAEATAALAEGEKADPAASSDAQVLWARAQSLRASSGDAAALPVLLELQPRVSSLPSSQERASALLLTALVLMATGEAELAKAISLLRAGAASSVSDRPLLLAALALSLDRQGERGEAATLMAEAAKGGAQASVERATQGKTPLLSRLDAMMLTAAIRAATDVPGAVTRWEAYLSLGGRARPFSARDAERVAELKKGKGAAQRRGR